MRRRTPRLGNKIMLSKKRLWILLLSGILFVVFMLFSGKLQTQEFSGEAFKGNEDNLAKEMSALIKQVSKQRHGDDLTLRFNQAKSLGCFEGQFRIPESVPEPLRHGVFAQPGVYPAKVRFANASTHHDGEKDLRGMSIRVSELEGQALWGSPGIQDFVLNSYPALFAATPEDFKGFIEAQLNDKVLRYFLKPRNWGALWIILKARDRHTSPFDIRYWSTTPFLLGPSQAVKYSVKSCSEHKSGEPDDYSQHYLRGAMAEHLDSGQVCFDFMVQVQTNNEDMPIEDASSIWSEQDSPFIPVAQLTFEKQEFLTKQALAACEAVHFNPWQSLMAHKPLGRMNYVRKQIYSELAAYRQQVNQARK